MYIKRVLSQECAALFLSLSLRFKYNMYIYIYILTTRRETTRLWPDSNSSFSYFLFFALSRASSPSLAWNAIHTHTQNTHKVSILYTGIYSGVQLMRVNDRARRQMRRQGDFARTLTSGRYRKRGLATENRPIDRPNAVLS